MAPNGDIFTAGNPGDIDFNGDGICGGAGAVVGDIDLNSSSACDRKAPVIYKSTDGLKWRSTKVGIDDSGKQGGTIIRDIAVSPKYPLDNFVVVVFSGGADTAPGAASDNNGLAYSTDGGNSFSIPFTGVFPSPFPLASQATGQRRCGGPWPFLQISVIPMKLVRSPSPAT